MSSAREVTSGAARRRILVVEEHAHRAEGHLPVLFADLAQNLVEAGCDVTVLTRAGWVHHDPTHPPPFRLARPGRVAYLATRLTAVLGRIPPSSAGRPLQRHLNDLIFVMSVIRLARRLNAETIVTSARRQSHFLLCLARAGRFVVYDFVGPREPALRWLRPLFERAARAAERSRTSHGGGLVIASNNEEHAQAWRELELGFTAIRMTFATSRVASPIVDARARLGLPDDWRVALCFGTEHPGKNPEIAFELFTALGASGEMPEWHLLVVGKIAERFAGWSAQHPGSVERIHLMPGYQSEETRNLVHAAADAQVLAFSPGWDLDSGVFGDSISWGVPVVCSSGNQTAVEVERLGMGNVFTVGDANSLGVALRGLPTEIDPDALRRARDEWSGAASAARHLSLLDSLGP